MNLRETQRTSNIDSLKINVNDIVLVFYEKVLPSRDSEIKRSNSENCKDQYNPQTSRK